MWTRVRYGDVYICYKDLVNFFQKQLAFWFSVPEFENKLGYI